MRDTRIPTFEYAIVNGQLQYRWANCVKDFNMKLKVYIDGQMFWLEPSQDWQTLELKNPITKIKADQDFYVASFQLTEINK